MMLRTFLLIFGLVSAATACSIRGPGETVCQAYSRADAVIIGKLNRLNDGVLRVNVQKTFKGKVRNMVELLQNGTSCDRNFSPLIGKELLLFLGKDNRENVFFERGYYSGGELKDSIDEIAWLEQLQTSLSRTRISGFLFSGRENMNIATSPLSDKPATIASKTNRFDVKTDANGFFQIWDVPPDTYWIELPTSSPDSILSQYLYGNGFFSISTSEISKSSRKTGYFRVEIDESEFRCGRIDSVLNVAK